MCVYIYMYVCMVCVCFSQSCLTLYDPTDSLPGPRLLCPRDSSVKNTGVDGRSLLQGIFLTQGSNSGLLYGRQILYHLSHQGIE